MGKDWRPVHRRTVPIEFVEEHWGIDGNPGWGEKPWPGWKRTKFWDTNWPVLMIFAIGLSGPLTLVLFFMRAVLR